MDPQFQTIHQFLEAFAPEVTGHSSSDITPTLEQDLQGFASGELEESRLNEVSRDLLSNEKAMERLASLLKRG